MKIPTKEECIKLLDEFSMPEHIREHTFVVNKIAVFLAKRLKQAGEEVNIGLVNAASLLHDLDKMETLEDISKHGKLAHRWLSEKEHSRVGEVVIKHVMHEIAESKDNSWEDKIIHYADQRCNDDRIVSIDERHGYVRKRYSDYFKEEYAKIVKNLKIRIYPYSWTFSKSGRI